MRESIDLRELPRTGREPATDSVLGSASQPSEPALPKTLPTKIYIQRPRQQHDPSPAEIGSSQSCQMQSQVPSEQPAQPRAFDPSQPQLEPQLDEPVQDQGVKTRKLPVVAISCIVLFAIMCIGLVGAMTLGWLGVEDGNGAKAGQVAKRDGKESTNEAVTVQGTQGNPHADMVGDEMEDAVPPSQMKVEFDGQEIDVATLAEPERRPLDEIGATGFMFNTLNDRQRQLYADILFQIRSRRRMFRVRYTVDYSANESWEALYRTIDAVLTEHPELFWVESAGDGYPYIDQVGPNEFFVGTFWNAGEDEIDGLQARIDGATEAYLSQASGAVTDYDKVLFTYDYDTNLCDYDHTNREDALNQSIRSALLDRKTVCSGYSKAMSYLLGKVGVQCWYVDVDCEPTEDDIADGVVLTERGKVPHACDIVCIDGTWHYLDATFGDALSSHYYMTMTSTDLDTIGHSISVPDVFPICKDTRWDYYHVTGWFMSSAVPESLQEAISEAATRGWHEVPMKCDSQMTYEGCVAQLNDYDWIVRTISEATGLDSSAVSPVLSTDDVCNTITVSW